MAIFNIRVDLEVRVDPTPGCGPFPRKCRQRLHYLQNLQLRYLWLDKWGDHSRQGGGGGTDSASDDPGGPIILPRLVRGTTFWGDHLRYDRPSAQIAMTMYPLSI